MSKKKKNKRQMQYRSDIERVSTVPRKVNKNVYRLVAVSVEEETSKKGNAKTSMKSRSVAYFNQGASLDLMKPLLATVRARYLFDRWQDKPSDKRRNKAARAYLKAKKLLGKRLQGHTPVTGTYEWSVVQICLDTLGLIGSSLNDIVKVTGPGEAGSADYSQTVPLPAEEAPKAYAGPFGAAYVAGIAAEASPPAPADLSSTADPPLPSFPLVPPVITP